MCVIFVARHQAAKVLQPANGTFDFPAAFDATQFSAVLDSRLNAINPVSANQLDLSPRQSGTQWIAVGRFVVKQPLRLAPDHNRVQQRFDQRHLIGTCAFDRHGHGDSMPFTVNHNLSSLASLGLADLVTPFFAAEKVPSAVVSSKSSFPCRSSARSSRAHAACQIPVSVQARWRRQHVHEEGNDFGKSFHRAPVRSTHRIPSTQGRGRAGGRPPLGEGSGFRNKSSMRSHCSFVSSGSGSIPRSRRGSSTSDARDRSFATCCLLSTALNCKSTANHPASTF